MTTWTALTTLPGEAAASALGAALELMKPAPSGLGIFEVEDGSGLWEVGGYFTSKPDPAALALLAAAFDAKPFAVSKLDDRDWVAEVRRELSPVEAGRFTVHGGHDAHRVGPHRLGLRIEAAMAFGTGHHGTTRGCLILLSRLMQRGVKARRVADIGCGTGVLAMAAARAWRVPVVATDLDAVAARTARANAGENGLAPWVRTGCAAGFGHPVMRRWAPFDLVFANILERPLMQLAPTMAMHLRNGGSAIVSGIMEHQVAGVDAVYRGHGLVREDWVRLGQWRSLLLRKRA
ncbi:MAG: 50S ribosomal protein L11 methyltransferase [Pseudomonadota bacterium]